MIHKADDDLRNIRVEDPRPTLQHFFLLMEGCEPWSDPEVRRKLHICPRSGLYFFQKIVFFLKPNIRDLSLPWSDLEERRKLHICF